MWLPVNRAYVPFIVSKQYYVSFLRDLTQKAFQRILIFVFFSVIISKVKDSLFCLTFQITLFALDKSVTLAFPKLLFNWQVSKVISGLVWFAIQNSCPVVDLVWLHKLLSQASVIVWIWLWNELTQDGVYSYLLRAHNSKSRKMINRVYDLQFLTQGLNSWLPGNLICFSL